MKNSARRLSLGIATAVALLLILPYFLPAGRFIREIEGFAGEYLHAPVRIGSLRPHFLPAPHLVITDIEVGKQPYLKIRYLKVTPQLSSILAERKIIREIQARGVTVGQQLLVKVLRRIQETETAGPTPLWVKRIVVRDASVVIPAFSLHDMQADLDLAQDWRLVRAEIRSGTEDMRMTLLPQDQEFSLSLSAQHWKLPAGPPLMFTRLKANGRINAAGLFLPMIRGQLYNGTVDGKIAVGWAKEWTIGGALQVHNVEIQPLAALYSNETTISGLLTANSVVDIKAPTAAQLADMAYVESAFRIAQGVLYKVDLAAAPKALLNKDAMKGGETRFDEFSGYVLVDRSGYQLGDLKISSGVLKAEGYLLISPQQVLSGRIEAAVKGTASLISTPLAVSGTVKNPILTPTRGTLAGAAAGTALLGPGFGTTIGMKAAQITERLFGKKPSRKTDVGVPPAPASSAEKSTPSNTTRQPATGR